MPHAAPSFETRRLVSSPAPRRRPVVLLVEDEMLLRMYAADVLEECGYDVLEATGALAALAILAEHRVDLLFTDIDLGDGPDGLTLARLVRDMRPDLPVIYASARPGLTAGEAVAKADFLSKPYGARQVEKAVARLLQA